MIPLLVFLEHYKDLISMHNNRFDHYKVRNRLTMSDGALKKFEIQDLQDPSFMMIPSYWGVSLSPLFTSKVLALLIWKIKSKRRGAHKFGQGRFLRVFVFLVCVKCYNKWNAFLLFTKKWNHFTFYPKQGRFGKWFP